MKTASITIRTDSQFKDQCDRLFQAMGMTTATAINTFLHQAVMENGMPFTPHRLKAGITTFVGQKPEAGYVNENGDYVLPADWYDAEDDVYEKLTSI